MDLTSDWPEVVSLLFLILGLLLALFAQNTVLSWGVAVLMGLLFGRIWYRCRTGDTHPVFLSGIACAIGLAIGSFLMGIRVLLLLFFVSAIAAYLLHKHDIIKSTEF